MITPSPILITGIPRSGSTMIAATINLCGAFGGEMSKRGMYSNDRIREELVKTYLEADRVGLGYIPINWKMEVALIMMQEGYQGGAWMYKDSNLSKMWKVWDHFYPDAKWIIVRRRTGDIIQSCMKTRYMIEHNSEEGWLKMVHEYEERLIALVETCPNHMIIWPERMLQRNYQQIYDMCDWLGMKWNPDALHFIDSLLWGNKQKKGVL